jgi:hypothetical protein
LNNAERETFIVIGDPTLNAQVNSGSRSEPCLKKDGSHLVLPNVTTVQEGKKTQQVSCSSKLVSTANDAAIVTSIKSQVVRSKYYQGSHYYVWI